MLLKPWKASSHQSYLEDRLNSAPEQERQWLFRDLAKAKAGNICESHAAYFINFAIEDDPDWAVIHDLRIEHGGRVAQIDHLLIHASATIYVVETKSVRGGVQINDLGEFERFDDRWKTRVGMESPLAQNERHIAVLRAMIKDLDLIPRRLFMRLRPEYLSLVLIAKDARIVRPQHFDTSRVAKADLAMALIHNDDKDHGYLSSRILMSRKQLKEFGQAILARHVAVDEETFVPRKVAPPKDIAASTPPHACSCGASRTIAYFKDAAPGYKWHCSVCGEHQDVSVPAGKTLHKSGNKFVLRNRGQKDGPEEIFFVLPDTESKPRPNLAGLTALRPRRA